MIKPWRLSHLSIVLLLLLQFFVQLIVFTTLHGMPAPTSYEKAVRLSNVWIVTKWKKDLSRFLYHTKHHLA